MSKLVILIGPPGSGKSTLAKAYEAKGFVRISQDDQGKGHKKLFEESLSQGKDIVVDRMNFDKQQRDRYRLPALAANYHIMFYEVVVPRELCYQRCMERNNHPTINGSKAWEGAGTGSKSLETMEFYKQKQMEEKSKQAESALGTYFSKYEELHGDELNYEFVREKLNATINKPTSIMVDLDGTLCNLNHRLHFVRGEGKKDWKSFFESMTEDSIYEDVADILMNEYHCGTEIVLCSGRPEDYRGHTEDWLVKHRIPYDRLVMRPVNNYKSDDITKAMLYRYEIEPRHKVKYVLDDRNQVVNKWREIGLSCFQVRPGDF
jgi:predicted kinase